MTTIINTHDMNSVLGIGEKVIYIYEGHKEWEGTKDDIFTSTNERLNNFIFASDLLRKVKDLEVQSMEAETGYSWKLGYKKLLSSSGRSFFFS